jgi:hypothetical protein
MGGQDRGGLLPLRAQRSVLLHQLVKPLIVRDDALQCLVASIGAGLAAIELQDGPVRVVVALDRDDHHAPRRLAILAVAQFRDDQHLDFVLGLGDLIQLQAPGRRCRPGPFHWLRITSLTWALARSFASGLDADGAAPARPRFHISLL